MPRLPTFTPKALISLMVSVQVLQDVAISQGSTKGWGSRIFLFYFLELEIPANKNLLTYFFPDFP